MAWSNANNSVSANNAGVATTLVTNAVYSDFLMRTDCIIPSSGNVAGLVLRQQQGSVTNYYLLTFSAGSSNLNLYIVNSGVQTLLDSSAFFQIPTNQKFTIEARAEGGWIVISINKQVVLTTYDTTFSSGFVGFYAYNPVTFSNFQMPLMFERIATFIINTSDTITNALSDALSVKAAYGRVNYLNQLAISVPQSTDTSVYTYYEEIQENDNTASDIENVNFCVVYGANGIAGSAINQASIDAHNKKVRRMTITDQTLTTIQQCITRATRELAVNSRYEAQPALTTVVNCGLELFDVITVHDGISGVDTTFRVMNISTQYNAEASDYSQNLDLSNP